MLGFPSIYFGSVLHATLQPFAISPYYRKSCFAVHSAAVCLFLVAEASIVQTQGIFSFVLAFA